jgi:hypothetical protein
MAAMGGLNTDLMHAAGFGFDFEKAATLVSA